MAYRYLLVDNDNTLMDFDRAEELALTDTLTAAGLPADADTCAAYHRINKALWEALERGETTQPKLKLERFAQLLTLLGASAPTPEALAASYHQHLATHAELMDGAMDFLTRVKPRMKIALVSNGVSVIQRGRLSRCAFTPLMDAIFISEECGVTKPDRRLIDLALSALGCTDPTQAVFLGDSLSADVTCAINAGIDSIWLAPAGRTDPRPTYIVHTLAEAGDVMEHDDEGRGAAPSTPLKGH